MSKTDPDPAEALSETFPRTYDQWMADPEGTLLFVLPQIIDPPSLASRFLAALGRGRTVSRALRATALVARGYVGVAAGVDRETRSDLVWGFTPAARDRRS